MAEFTNTPYMEIVKIAILPAILYYFATYCYVHFRARKLHILPLDEKDIPRLLDVVKGGFQFLLPVAVLIYFLVANYSPMMVGFAGVVSVLIVTMMRRETRVGPGQLLKLLEKGTRNAVMVSVACAAAGIIVGVVTLTGLGLKFSSMILSLSGGVLFFAILLVGVASLILGMGLPVTASYIVLVILAGPALMEMGLWLLGAHMIVFWYSQTSNVTPPVALAAFAGAGIAGASPMKTGLAACQVAVGLYILPLLMAYRPLLLNGSLQDVVISALSVGVGLLTLSSLVVGFLFRENRAWEQVALGCSTVGLFLPSPLANGIGFLILLGLWFLQKRRRSPGLTS
jgi:TRAP transporter 4TM/12TM fusion protein